MDLSKNPSGFKSNSYSKSATLLPFDLLLASTPQSSPDSATEELPAATEIVAPETPAPETEADLFERVFGQPQTSSQAVLVPFFLNEQAQGQVLVYLDAGHASLIQADIFLESTSGVLRPQLQEQLTAAVDNTGSLSLDAIRQAGLAVVFDQNKLELYIQIEPTLRRTNVIGLYGEPLEAAEALPNSHVSGYVNLRGGEEFDWSGRTATDSVRQPLHLSMDGALNVEGWVLEGSINWVEDEDPAFTRGDIRLVRDDPAQAVRYGAGDLSVPVTGFFQSSIPMVGVSVSRNYGLQPYRVTRPLGTYTFFLERPSDVQIFVNGIRIQQLTLPAGSQDIRNLPLSTGLNDIQLIIQDDLGQIERLNFSTSVAGNLLTPGLEQFSYNVGFPTTIENGRRTYDWNEPTLLLSHRWGICENLTLGGYIQAQSDYQLAGIQGTWASSLGNWGWEVAVSHSDDVGTDGAARLQYEYSQSGANHPENPVFRLAMEYRGENFSTLDTLEPTDYIWDLSAYYSQIISGNINANLSSRYQIRPNDSDLYTISLGLSRSFNNGFNVALNVSYGPNHDGEDEARAFLGLYWMIPRQRQSLALNTSANTENDVETQLDWNFSPDHPVQSVGGRISATRRLDGYTLSGNLAYTNYRFIAGLSHDTTFSNDRAGVENTTQITFGTALVFADGYFSWSRPITNSFALIAPHSNWRNQQIGVNPADQGYDAVADRFGPAVIPDLQPYYVSQVHVEAPDAPLGYELGDNSFILLPSYRSGTLIRVGSDATVFLRGVLVDASDHPISLQAGQLVSISDTAWQPLTLFTNRIGRFVLPGLKPGQYEIIFPNQGAVQFEIPEGFEGLYDAGTLPLSGQP